jgi:hypothetical protein
VPDKFLDIRPAHRLHLGSVESFLNQPSVGGRSGSRSDDVAGSRIDFHESAEPFPGRAAFGLRQLIYTVYKNECLTGAK